ncbi:beta-lactamase/transpeptidase-like protein [Catenaria anguillulae PL171]|uniref:Beta-lactamase/transpeptidase-like protein n=1 Tax=Catenaria anguillulae PL171 TaxID=765915 RepID=A0A1Y2I151_9FUNG|nr:beta-lactamase/transpeptidase-like protein [Catenaria anguillulae PL171]
MGDQFRSSLHYSNLCYALATRIIEEVSGQAFPDFVAEHLFDPLGIQNYEWCYRAFANHPNAALPHVAKAMTLDELARDVIYGPAKSLDDRRKECQTVSSGEAALDICRQNRRAGNCLINDGKAPDGETQVVHELDTIAKVHNPDWYTLEKDVPAGSPRTLGYGLGLVLRHFGEHEIWSHDGGMPGVRTRLFVLPRSKIAIYVASNADAVICPSLATWILHAVLPRTSGYPEYMAASNFSWTSQGQAVPTHFPSVPNPRICRADVARAADQVPALPCDPLDLAGTYFHPGRLGRGFGEDSGLKVGGPAFFTCWESPMRLRFAKDESVKDTRPLPKRKAALHGGRRSKSLSEQ